MNIRPTNSKLNLYMLGQSCSWMKKYIASVLMIGPCPLSLRSAEPVATYCHKLTNRSGKSGRGPREQSREKYS